jgi:hypothetical protein
MTQEQLEHLKMLLAQIRDCGDREIKKQIQSDLLNYLAGCMDGVDIRGQEGHELKRKLDVNDIKFKGQLAQDIYNS